MKKFVHYRRGGVTFLRICSAQERLQVSFLTTSNVVIKGNSIYAKWMSPTPNTALHPVRGQERSPHQGRSESPQREHERSNDWSV